MMPGTTVPLLVHPTAPRLMRAVPAIGRPQHVISAWLRLGLLALVLLSAWSSPSSAAVLSMTARAAMPLSWVMTGEGDAFPS